MENKITVKEWIISHDDSKWFVISYIVLAVVLSTFISLFWLLVVVALHGVMEYFKQSDKHSENLIIFKNILWELKLDIALIFFSFVIHLYLGYVMGVAGLGGLARAGSGVARATTGVTRGIRVVNTASRFVIIQRTIRSAMMMLDEFVLTIRGIFLGKKGKNAGKDKQLQENHTPEGWTFGDKFTVSLGVLCIALIFSAPFFTEHSTLNKVMSEILNELKPLP